MTINFHYRVADYNRRLGAAVGALSSSEVNDFFEVFMGAITRSSSIYLAGNGGSGANCCHIANDFMLPFHGENRGRGRVISLCENPSTLTCLGNDIGFDNIFSYPISKFGDENDLCIVLSGSGNSTNILNAIRAAKKKKMFTIGILGFDGGEARSIVDQSVLIPCNDMQICEDIQMILFNNVLQYQHQFCCTQP